MLLTFNCIHYYKFTLSIDYIQTTTNPIYETIRFVLLQGQIIKCTEI